MWCFSEKDATHDFEDVGHSDDAKKEMKKYLIGEIDISTIPSEPFYQAPLKQAPPPHAAASDQSSALKMLQYLVPLLIMGFALVMQFHGKKAIPAEPEL